ncbi:RNA-directed DNA polymerase, eukaryota, reverse transcriptase zinc-binding domain protein [Tanacetum coccineum]|uniref:RNA-directed DNA polymerase, eukaryota, reverse transcriptase zinc-binding domain protein n=1 Tax=Tanacetum coccineum TaxID=301880 RepID=A0ABQ5GFK5_9ASTR
MNVLSLNIQGLGHKAKKEWVKELSCKYSINFLSLQETKMELVDEGAVRSLWGNLLFDYDFSPAVGNSGIWKFTGDRMLMIGVYAHQEILEKRLLWDYLHGVLDSWKGEVILMGDFNEVRMPSERRGSVFNKQGAALFNSFILSPNDSVTDAIDRHLSDHRVVVDSWQLDVVTGDNAMTCLKKKFQDLKGKLREWSHASRSEANDRKLKIQREIQNIDRQLDIGECGEDLLSTHHHQVVDSESNVTKDEIRRALEEFIIDSFKIIIKDASESDTDMESEGSEASLHYTNICSDDPFGIYDLLNQKVAEKEIEQVVSDDSSHPPGFTKDVELEQKVGEVDINVDKEGGFNETFKLVSQLGVSRSNDRKQYVDKLETRVGISKIFVPCSLVCGKQPRVNLSLLDKLNDFVEIGQAMGFFMEGLGHKAKKEWVKELSCKYSINFLSLQETKMELVDEGAVRSLWGNLLFDYAFSPAVGNSGGVKELAQKVKVKWAIEGDEKSKFFHVNSRISYMCDFPHVLDHHQVVGLESNVTEDEIQRAVWDCGVDKSSGPDGFTFEFIQKFWDVVGVDIIRAIKCFFDTSKFPKGCNPSFIALIPKITDAKLVKDYRPISLIGSTDSRWSDDP